MIDLIINEASSSTNATPYDLRPKLWEMPSEILDRIVQLTPREDRKQIIGVCKNLTQAASYCIIAEELNSIENFILEEVVNRLLNIPPPAHMFIPTSQICELKNLITAMRTLKYANLNEFKENLNFIKTALIDILSTLPTGVLFAMQGSRKGNQCALGCFEDLRSRADLHASVQHYSDNKFNRFCLLQICNTLHGKKFADEDSNDFVRFIKFTKDLQVFSPNEIVYFCLRVFPISNFEYAKIALCLLNEVTDINSLDSTVLKSFCNQYYYVVTQFAKQGFMAEALQIIRYVKSRFMIQDATRICLHFMEEVFAAAEKKEEYAQAIEFLNEEFTPHALMEREIYPILVNIILNLIKKTHLAEALQLIEFLNLAQANDSCYVSDLIGHRLTIAHALLKENYDSSAIQLLSQIQSSFTDFAHSKIEQIAAIFYDKWKDEGIINKFRKEERNNFYWAPTHIFCDTDSKKGNQSEPSKLKKKDSLSKETTALHVVGDEISKLYEMHQKFLSMYAMLRKNLASSY